MCKAAVPSDCKVAKSEGLDDAKIPDIQTRDCDAISDSCVCTLDSVCGCTTSISCEGEAKIIANEDWPICMKYY